MTEHNLKTTKENADAMHVGIKSFDYRYLKDNLRVGDRIRYTVIQERKRVRHPISEDVFKVMYIDRYAPQLQDGVVTISLKKLD
jgi:hypothetical protein